MSRQRKNAPWAWVVAIPWPVWLSLTLAGLSAFAVLLLTGRGPEAVVALLVAYACAGGYADSLRARRKQQRRSARTRSRKGARR